MREALETFLGELKSARRFSPHTLAAYRRDIERVFDLAVAVRATEAEELEAGLAPRHEHVAQPHRLVAMRQTLRKADGRV